MFCPRCGEKLPDSANFCTACGMEFDDSIKSSLSSNERTKNKESKKSGKGKLCVPFILIIGIAIAGFTIYEENASNLTIEGVNFYIPSDYQLEDEMSYESVVPLKSSRYVFVLYDGEIYSNGSDRIYIDVFTFEDDNVSTIDDVYTELYFTSDMTNTTINGHDGVMGLFYRDDYKMFMYMENDKLVRIKCTDPDLIDTIVV